MGCRINYYCFVNGGGKTLKEMIVDHYQSFKEWHSKTAANCLAEFGEEFGSAYLREKLLYVPELSNNFYLEEQQFIDELTYQFIDYCDSADIPELETSFVGPSVNVINYRESDDWAMQAGNSDFWELWRYLTIGRSLKGNAIFAKQNLDYSIGFLSCSEQKKLKSFIEMYAGDSIGNGAELVLQALDEMAEKEVELITTVE